MTLASMRCLPLLVMIGGMPAFGAAEVFKITTDRTVDNTSLESIVADAIRLADAKTNDEKAIAIHKHLHRTIFHWAYPTEKKPQSVGPLKLINVYGWGLCGGQHTVLKALFETQGWECRYVGWPGHTTIEVKYDDKWHYFDTFLKCYYWTKDKSHVAGQEEIAKDPSIVLDAVKDERASAENLCCGDSAEGVVSGCQKMKVVGDSKGWASVTWRDNNYNPLLTLRSGASLRQDWKHEPEGYTTSFVKNRPPQHSCGTKDFRNDAVLGPILEHYGPRNWSNGQFTYKPDFGKAGDVADIELKDLKAESGRLAGSGSAIFNLTLPYCYVTGTLAAEFEGEGKLALSADGGKTWAPVQAGDVTAQVKQKYDVLVKAETTGAIKTFSFEGRIEHNRTAQPYLFQGKNVVTVATKENKVPEGCVLKVVYAYQEATAPENRSRWDGKGVTYGETKTVSHQIEKLPFTFEIEAGGNTHPKMLSIERAVVAK